MGRCRGLCRRDRARLLSGRLLVEVAEKLDRRLIVRSGKVQGQVGGRIVLDEVTVRVKRGPCRCRQLEPLLILALRIVGLEVQVDRLNDLSVTAELDRYPASVVLRWVVVVTLSGDHLAHGRPQHAVRIRLLRRSGLEALKLAGECRHAQARGGCEKEPCASNHLRSG